MNYTNGYANSASGDGSDLLSSNNPWPALNSI
jgi:hypothetical protein